jgi:diguanylate cyclase (GGDEF)-like protein
MSKTKNIRVSSFQDNKWKLIEKSYFMFYIVTLIATLLCNTQTVYGEVIDKNIILIVSAVSVLASIIILITKKYVKNINIKSYIYMSVNVVYFLVLNLFFLDKHFIFIAAIVNVFFILIFFMLSVKMIIIFSIFPVSIISLYIIGNPTLNITVGRGYYLVILFAYIVTIYLTIKAVRLFKGYELILRDKLSLVNEQNQELIAYNEEFIATEQELFDKYEKIQSLNSELSQNINKLNSVLTVTEDGLIELDLETNEVIMNEITRELFKLNKNEKMDFSILDELLGIEDLLNIKKAYVDIRDDLKEKVEVDFLYKKNSLDLYFRVTLIKYIGNNTEKILASIKNITLEKEHELNMYDIAYVDKLTGISNRTAFSDELDLLLEDNKNNVSIYILDIKNIKSINITFGFDMGDEILKFVALKLQKNFIEAKIVSRIDGNVFALLFDKVIEPNEVREILFSELKIFYGETFNFPINFNIGVAYHDDEKDSIELIEKAEIAMYMAKNNNISNLSIYNSEYRKEVKRRLKISSKLENAIERKEIYLNYQPKVNSITEKIIGFESLVRWDSKKMGLISPSEFIKIAERSGYIIKLGKYIIEEACRFIKKANVFNEDIIVSINISGIQLLSDNFENLFLDIVDKYEIPKKNIGIEITETAVIENLEKAKQVLNNLHDVGITIYLDDFGKGFSSLNYLNNLPIDVLKIDKSFIDNIVVDTKQLALVKNIIILSKELGLKIVAEGVETEEQFLKIKELKCDTIQGYYFYKPCSEIEALEKISLE